MQGSYKELTIELAIDFVIMPRDVHNDRIPRSFLS